jgi:hypothetical protein
MKRIIIHWTAGAKGLNSVEADSYHFIVQPDGKVDPGDFPVSANIPPLKSGQYAAHTRNCNSYSIGIALDAMAGARERPFDKGSNPITQKQLEALCDLAAGLCGQYGIDITPQTVLTHAEVEPTLGIKQKNKWDVTWIPGMQEPGDPVFVGDRIRDMIRAAQRPASTPSDDIPSSFFAAIRAAFKKGKP